MTFTLPEALASRLVNCVPAGKRSKYVAKALNEKLFERDRRLKESCLLANNGPDVQAIEKECDAIIEN
jgi:hypothetical protein